MSVPTAPVPRRRRPLTALAASLAITLVLFALAEAAVRLAGVEPREWPSADNPLSFPGVKVDPLLGALPRPGWSGQWLGDFAVTADERGFRASGLPPPGDPRARVAVLGDSCSFGWGVDTPDTFAAQLDARQRDEAPPAIEFLNAAYPGQSAVAGLYMLRERVAPLRPDLVVLGFSGNNAFRFSLVSDAERFRRFDLRRLVLRSRLLHILAAEMANRNAPGRHPRERKAIGAVPLPALRRVAASREFTAAVREMVADARAAGAEPVFLILPRAVEVADEFRHEDAAFTAALAPGQRPKALVPQAVRLLELSCLDPHEHADLPAALQAGLRTWRPLFPQRPEVRRLLQAGAAAYAAGNLVVAHHWFVQAAALDPASPLARYDLGATELSNGDAAGLRELLEADRLACNTFLHYQVLLWEIAHDLGVPVVDATLYFQAHDGEPLFLDEAHPNAAGHRIIADALWPVVSRIAEGKQRPERQSRH